MKALRLVLLGIALAVFAGLVWRTAMSHRPVTASNDVPLITAPAAPTEQPAETVPAETSSPPTPVSQPPTVQAPDASAARQQILSRMGDAPDYTPFFDRYRSEFPADYQALVEGGIEALEKGGRAPNPDRLMTEAVRGLKQSKGVLAAQAEDGPLDSIFQAQAALVDVLAQGNPALCVDFLYGGISPSFMAFAATHRELIERLGIANLSAIASGQRSRVSRPQPTNDDFDLLNAALQKGGLSADEISALLDGKTFDPPLPEARLCEAGRTYLHVLEGLPDDTKFRLYALSAALPARS